MNNSKNIKLLYCILGSFILVLLQSPLFFNATYAIFGGSSGTNALSLSIYNLFKILSFIGVNLIAIFSILLVVLNINFTKK